MIRMWTILLCLLETFLLSEAALPPPEDSYKVLILIPFSIRSHRNVFLPIAEGLAERGHKVVIVSPLSPATNHRNIYEIQHDVITYSEEGGDTFDMRKNDKSGGFAVFKEFLPKIARELYTKQEIQKLYLKRDEFDVVLIDAMANEPAYPFTYKKPFILVSTNGRLPTYSASMGNVFNPAYIPLFAEYDRPFSFIDRIRNLFGYLSFALMWRRDVIPPVQAEIDKHFPGIPSLVDLEKNVSLVLMNTHFSLDISSPNLQSEIEVGAMHCRPGKELNGNLTEWIEGAGSAGVVYFSLGSVTRGTFMPEEYRELFIGAFSRLKQRVIWKYESDIPNLPKNILRDRWFPQQDILAHPNVKVFITHGGVLSYQEAIFHKTPLIALPIFADQPRNGARIQNKGFGYNLVWEELTEDMIVNAIEDIVSNSKYQKVVEATSNSLKDQPMLPRDLAVWWTEYVIRHKGAPALRSPAADLSWVEYFMLDLIFLLHLLFYIFYKILKAFISNFVISGNFPTEKQKTN